METAKIQNKYIYTSASLNHHHAYLFPLIMRIISLHNPHKSRLRILDIGCGNGSFSNLFSQQGYEVTGIEESDSGINLARSNFPSCQFIQSNIYELPYLELEKSFDVVISVEVIEHLMYPKELIKAAKKCLKPSGKMILTTPYHGYLKNLALAISGKMDRHFTALWDGGHIKFFSVNTMKTLLEMEEFTNIEFKFAGRFPYLWKSMVCSSSLNKANVSSS